MKYIRLSNLSNPYPQPGNYIRKITANALAYDFTSGDSVLYGLYPETNQIPFYLPNLNAVRAIEDVSFRFILKVKKYPSDEYPSYFTGTDFYKDLESSIEIGNPYFINTAVRHSFMVEFDLLESLRYFKELQTTESELGLTILQNNFLKFISPELIQEITAQSANELALGTNKENFDFVNELQTNPYLELIDEDGIYVDYKLLVQYIDWIVKAPDLTEVDNGSVLPAESLIKYYKKEQINKPDTTAEVVDNTNQKNIADVLDNNAEITNPGGGGYSYSGGGGGGGNYMQYVNGNSNNGPNNYGNRREYR